MKNWSLYNTNLPNVVINDLQINYVTDELWAATFGRGLWKTKKYDPLPNSISIVPYANDVIKAWPNPNKGAFQVTTNSHLLTGQMVNIQLVNTTGKTCWQTEGRIRMDGKMTVTTIGLPRGPYLLVIKQGNFQARQKIIIF